MQYVNSTKVLMDFLCKINKKTVLKSYKIKCILLICTRHTIPVTKTNQEECKMSKNDYNQNEKQNQENKYNNSNNEKQNQKNSNNSNNCSNSNQKNNNF